MVLLDICKNAKAAKPAMIKLSTKEKNGALLAVADGLIKDCSKILEANRIDYENGEKMA